MTAVYVRYTTTKASILAGISASNDFVKMGLYLAVFFGAVMCVADSDTVSSWTSAPAVWGWLWPSVLAGIGFGTFMTLVVAFILLPVQARRLWRQNPLIYGDMELEANDLGMTIKGPRSSTAYAWSDLLGFKESRPVFVIALSKSVSFAIPKAGMTPETESALRAILEAHLRWIRSRGLA